MKINVIGSGSMGKQIISLLTLMGFDIFLWEHTPNKNLKEQLNKEIEKLKPFLDNYVIGNLTIVSNLYNLDDNLTIETIKEDINIKKKILNSLKYKNNIFSNTSSIKLEKIGPYINGLHFMNPISLKYIELCERGNFKRESLDILINKLKDFSYKIIEVTDSPGFLINKLIFKDISYFFYLIEQENFKKNDILDIYKKTLIKNDPIKILNMIGLDTCLSIFENLNEYDKNFYIPLCLKKAVKENVLGYKNKKLLKV